MPALTTEPAAALTAAGAAVGAAASAGAASGAGAAVSSAFEVQGDRADDAVYLFLDATGQEPGLYTLTVTVRDRISGLSADRETDLLLE